MPKDQLREAVQILLTDATIGELLDAVQYEVIDRAERVRSMDRLSAATLTVASLRIGDAARYCLNLGI